jgi:hypothetical protein
LNNAESRAQKAGINISGRNITTETTEATEQYNLDNYVLCDLRVLCGYILTEEYDVTTYSSGTKEVR